MRAADVASRLGLKRYSQSWRGRCPCCDYNGTTFLVRAGRNGQAHLFCANGCGGDELQRTVAIAAGLPPLAAVDGDRKPAATSEQNLERALALWRRSDPALGTIADRYLIKRGLPDLAATAVLRFCGDTPHPEHPRLPALIALVQGVMGRPIGVHRTYLTLTGGGASVEPRKASLGPIWGGAVRLHPATADVPLVIGEGIETAASAARLMNMPGWAAISAGNLAKGLLLPPEVQSVIIAADPDSAGQAAARDARLRWLAEGRAVQIATPKGTRDFNDVLRMQAFGHD